MYTHTHYIKILILKVNQVMIPRCPDADTHPDDVTRVKSTACQRAPGQRNKIAHRRPGAMCHHPGARVPS